MSLINCHKLLYMWFFCFFRLSHFDKIYIWNVSSWMFANLHYINVRFLFNANWNSGMPHANWMPLAQFIFNCIFKRMSTVTRLQIEIHRFNLYIHAKANAGNVHWDLQIGADFEDFKFKCTLAHAVGAGECLNGMRIFIRSSNQSKVVVDTFNIRIVKWAITIWWQNATQFLTKVQFVRLWD